MFRISKTVLIVSTSVFTMFLGTHVFAAITGLPVLPSPAPSPNDINSIPGLISYIYNLAFWIVGIAVFFQVLRAGFIIFFSAAGSASKISEGKKLIWNAIVGLILLFASWMILNVINPDLVKNTFDFGSLLQGSSNGNPNPTIPGGAGGSSQKYGCNSQNACVADSNGQYTSTNCDNKCGGGTPTPQKTPRLGKGGDCTPLTSGVCTPDNLKNQGNWDSNIASIVCRGESGGNPDTPPANGDACYLTDPSQGGKPYPVSFGLFQILIYGGSYNPQFSSACSGVLNYVGCWVPKVTKNGVTYCPKRKCTFGSKGESGYNTCVAAVKSADPNIKQAVNLYHTPLGWNNWSAYKMCKNRGLI